MHRTRLGARLPTTLSMIPGDLLLEIAYHLDSRQELVNFSLTVSLFLL